MAEHMLATHPDVAHSAVLLSCARPATAYGLQYAELLAGAAAGRGLSPVTALGMILTPAELQDDGASRRRTIGSARCATGPPPATTASAPRWPTEPPTPPTGTAGRRSPSRCS